MKPRLRLAFSDFWSSFDPADNYFTQLLGEKYQIELSDRPDFLIYSCFGNRYRKFRGIRIYYTGETRPPDFSECDFAFSFYFLNHPNHFRLPVYALHYRRNQPPIKQNDADLRALLVEHRRFCNFVYSNKYCPQRNRFFRELSKYKHVDAGGRMYNNVGGRVPDKLEFIRNYKFTIAFENESCPGYTTEKIYEPMLVNSLPIYWGNPMVHLDFNPSSFLNFHDYGSYEALIERVIEVDRNDDLFCQYMRQPWLHHNCVNEYTDRQNILAQFDRIFSTTAKPVAQQRRIHQILLIDQTRRGARKWKRKLIRKAQRPLSLRSTLDLAAASLVQASSTCFRRVL